MPVRPAQSRTVGALILGAGFSRRFGSDKRLHAFHGSTVAEQTIESYRDVFDDVKVVVRVEDDNLISILKALNVNVLVTDQAHLGMGHTLAAGVRDLTWQYAFVGLLDMPFIEKVTLRKMIDLARLHRLERIVRPKVKSQTIDGFNWGHPIGWPRHYFQEMATLQGDQGARHLLQQYSDQATIFESEDTGLCQDIDQPSDLP